MTRCKNHVPSENKGAPGSAPDGVLAEPALYRDRPKNSIVGGKEVCHAYT